MTFKIAPDDVAAIDAYALLFGRVKPDDRRMLSLIAMADLRNLPVLTCHEHPGPYSHRMTFTGTYRHITDAAQPGGSPCRITVDLADIEVEQ